MPKGWEIQLSVNCIGGDELSCNLIRTDSNLWWSERIAGSSGLKANKQQKTTHTQKNPPPTINLIDCFQYLDHLEMENKTNGRPTVVLCREGWEKNPKIKGEEYLRFPYDIQYLLMILKRRKQKLVWSPEDYCLIILCQTRLRYLRDILVRKDVQYS